VTSSAEEQRKECPYCLGEGTVKRRYGTVEAGPAKIVKTRDCPLCGGRGDLRAEDGTLEQSGGQER
jgi:DnaJ-class molecular chaperone